MKTFEIACFWSISMNYHRSKTCSNCSNRSKLLFLTVLFAILWQSFRPSLTHKIGSNINLEQT